MKGEGKMKKAIVIIRNLETKEIIGMIEPNGKINPIMFVPMIMTSWVQYFNLGLKLDLDKYIEYHNSKFPVNIKRHKEPEGIKNGMFIN